MKITMSFSNSNERKRPRKKLKCAIEILEYNASQNNQKIAENIIFDIFKNINQKTNDYFIFNSDGKILLISWLLKGTRRKKS